MNSPVKTKRTMVDVYGHTDLVRNRIIKQAFERDRARCQRVRVRERLSAAFRAAGRRPHREPKFHNVINEAHYRIANANEAWDAASRMLAKEVQAYEEAKRIRIQAIKAAAEKAAARVERNERSAFLKP